jgi:hypothetical protein
MRPTLLGFPHTTALDFQILSAGASGVPKLGRRNTSMCNNWNKLDIFWMYASRIDPKKSFFLPFKPLVNTKYPPGYPSGA